jgi:hypothetical protein
MRYSAAEKLEMIRLVEQSHLPVRRALAHLGIPPTTFYRWCERYLWIGVEKGPPWRGDRRPKGTPLLKGFTLALGEAGGHVWDAGGGDDREDPSAA